MRLISFRKSVLAPITASSFLFLSTFSPEPPGADFSFSSLTQPKLYRQDLELTAKINLKTIKVQQNSVIYQPIVVSDASPSAPLVLNKPKPTPVSTPSPPPSLRPVLPPPPVTAPEQLEPLYQIFAKAFGVDANLLKSIGRCESRHNPRATNGPYAGIFQFSSSTWESTRKLMGLDPNPELRFNPEEAIRTAAFKISIGGIRAWANCARHFL